VFEQDKEVTHSEIDKCLGLSDGDWLGFRAIDGFFPRTFGRGKEDFFQVWHAWG
jgi:hypothetical protein